jgi:hypothetical protein
MIDAGLVIRNRGDVCIRGNRRRRDAGVLDPGGAGEVAKGLAAVGTEPGRLGGILQQEVTARTPELHDLLLIVVSCQLSVVSRRERFATVSAWLS